MTHGFELPSGEDAEDLATEHLPEFVKTVLMTDEERRSLVDGLDLDDVTPAVDAADHFAPASNPTSIPPNVPANGTSPYRTYQLALLAAFALTCGTTRYFVTGSDASGSDMLTASTVPSVPKPPVQPVDPAFEAAKRVAEADLRRLNGFAYTPECERLATVGLTARKDELAQGHKVIEHVERPDLNVPAHVDFGVASLGQNESVLCWTQHPGATHSDYLY